MYPMLLRLAGIPKGILHGPDHDDYNGQVPTRALFMAPDAGQMLLQWNIDCKGQLIITDIFRDADASLRAVEGKSGTLPPGFSGHGYGLCIDFEIKDTLRAIGCTYPSFLDLAARYGYYCHRRDGQRGSEDFHFNYLGTASPEQYLELADLNDHTTWKEPVEMRVQERYGSYFRLEPAEVQRALADCKERFYDGAIDGILGPKSAAGIVAFQQRWRLKSDGVAGPITQRTLAYVTAQSQIVGLPVVS
jgi:hypothetical protein